MKMVRNRASRDNPPTTRPPRRSAPWLAALALLAGCDPSPSAPDSAAVVDAATPPDAAMRVDAFVSRDDADMPLDTGAADPDARPSEDAGLDAPADGGPDAWARPGPVFTDAERAMIATLGPLPALGPDPTNAVADNPAAARLGQALFFDARYSGPLVVASDLGAVGERGRVSCASCHSTPAMSDSRSVPDNVSLGTNFHTRNAPAIVNSAFYPWTNWGGRFARPWELPPVVAESGLTMNSTRLEVAHHLFDHYRTEYEAVFGPMEPAIGSDPVRFPPAGKPRSATGTDGPWETMRPADQVIVNRIFVNFGKVLQAYMRLLVSRDSDFDRFASGAPSAIGPDAQWGLRVFLGRGRCVSCHSGPHLSDGTFHNIGVAQTGMHVPASDDGRFSSIPSLLTSGLNAAGPFSDDATLGASLLAGLTNPAPESTRAQFRTPTLRDLEHTGPYMHAGQMATLEEVIAFYDAGGAVPASGTLDPLMVPLGLTEEERSDLLAFLRVLTSDPVPESLRMAP